MRTSSIKVLCFKELFWNMNSRIQSSLPFLKSCRLLEISAGREIDLKTSDLKGQKSKSPRR